MSGLNRDKLGQIGGYKVVDLVAQVAFAYVLALRLDTPVAPTIAAVFVGTEVFAYKTGVQTPLLSALGVQFFFPAPESGRHLSQRTSTNDPLLA